MEFDKSKVYTAVNADEVKVGSKGYFSRMLGWLKRTVEAEQFPPSVLTEILNEDCVFRFCRQDAIGRLDYSLFYLVEEPEEKSYRPYKDTDEMIEDFSERYNSYNGNINKGNPMYCPLIWVKGKINGVKALVVGIGDGDVFIRFGEDPVIKLDFLFKHFTYLDGTPCGKLEQ